jgi:hypothetical protein
VGGSDGATDVLVAVTLSHSPVLTTRSAEQPVTARSAAEIKVMVRISHVSLPDADLGRSAGG